MISAVALSLFALKGANAWSAADPFAESTLAQAVWQHAPALIAERQQLVEAEALRRRTYLLPNPILTASWATIPVGQRNPPEAGFWQVPNYGIQMSAPLEFGKRGPRQRAAEAGTKRVRWDLEDAFGESFFTLLETLAEQAEAVGRSAVLERLAADSAEGLRLQRARAQRGDVAGLEVDRLEVEHLRLLSSVSAAAALTEAAVARCTQTLGVTCPRFLDDQQGLRFLAVSSLPPVPSPGTLAARPDVQSLTARQAESAALFLLARRQRIPDVALTLGYQRDQFVASGSQANSLNVALAIALPLSDRGQVEAARASQTGALASSAREVLMRSAAEMVTLARARITFLTQQASTLDSEAIPRAQSVFQRMEAAARRGGAALQDVLIARRALEELQLDRVSIEAERFRAVVAARRAAGQVPLIPQNSRLIGVP